METKQPLKQQMTWPEILRAHIDECGECRRDLMNLCCVGHIIRLFAGAEQIDQLVVARVEMPA